MIKSVKIDIIIVNWNAGSQLKAVIKSIAQHHQLVESVVIVDNNSSDDSLSQLEALLNLPFNLQIIRNTDNRGFGAACNQGAAMGKSEFLLFLNPDTLLFEDSLTVPLNFMQRPENSDVGIVGIQLVDENEHIARSCARFPSIGIFLAKALGVNRLPGLRHLSQAMSEWDHTTTRQVAQVIGAFFFIRRTTFDLLGGFDERFFVYFEEVDLSYRAFKNGWRCFFLANAQAFHAGGGTSQQVKAHRLFYSVRSRILYGFKHFNKWQVWLLLSISLVLEPLSRMTFALLRGRFVDVGNTFNAYQMLYRNLPYDLKKAP